jgi:hypothetical protein
LGDPSQGLLCHWFILLSTLLKENRLKMSEFLKNKYFFNGKSPSCILIPENDDFLKEKCPSFARILEK